MYKKCYYTCETCEIKGDNITHNCLECNTDFSFSINVSNYTNCYENCSYYYYFDNENNYHCTKNLSCPNENPILISETKECIKGEINIYTTSAIYYKTEELTSNYQNKTYFEKYTTILETQKQIKSVNITNIIQNILLKKDNNKTKDKEDENNYYNEIIDSIENVFTSENYDTSKLDDGEDQVIETEKMTVILTTSQNQKSNINNNMTTIDLGECETLLRKFHKISENEAIYMKITNVVQEGMAAIKVEYDVYARISGSKLSKLNITVCEKSKIDLSIPVEIKDNLDKLNSSSDYFNNICYQATSDSGTDISLNDRKKEFVDGNNTVCQEDCDFSEYNKTSKKAKCSCKVKESSSSFMDMTINKTKLLENFGDIKSFLNINLLTCYENIFKIGGIVHNIGFYLVIFIIIFHIISFFIFIFKKISKIRKIINHIIFCIKNRKLVQTEKKDEENEIIIENNIDDENNKKLKSNKKRKKSKKGKKGRKSKKGGNIDLIDSKQIKSININNSNKTEIINNNDFINRNRNQFLIQAESGRQRMNSNKKEKIIEKVKKIMKYIDNEINFLPYKLALVYDKRTFFKFYISLLKTKHNLIFSFFYNNDYNSKIVKIDL